MKIKSKIRYLLGAFLAFIFRVNIGFAQSNREDVYGPPIALPLGGGNSTVYA
jgi:hypothetical protein